MRLSGTGACRWFMKYRNIVGRDRHITFEVLYVLANQRNLKRIVETGCIRSIPVAWGGDGGSSIILSDLALLLDGMLDTVDIDSIATKITEELTQIYSEFRTVHCQDSIQFLTEYRNTIDVLYLDSGNSEELQRKEIEVALPLLSVDSIVLLDDLPTKGTKAIDYLLDNNWILHTCVYQALLVHKESIGKEYTPNVYAEWVADIPSFSEFTDDEWNNIRRNLIHKRRELSILSEKT